MAVLRNIFQTYIDLNQTITWWGIVLFMTTSFTVWLFYAMLIKPFLSPLRKIPGLPYNPLFGNMLEAVTGETGEVMLKWVKEYGSIFRYYFFFGRERIMVADADALKRIFVTNSHNYIKPPSRMAIVERLVGRGLLLLEGEEHAVQKRIISPAFKPSSLKRMMHVFEEYSWQLVEKWKKISDKSKDYENTTVEVQHDFTLVAFDIIGKCAFGYDFDSLSNHQGETVTACFNRIIGGTGLSWTMAVPYYHHLPTPGNRSFNKDKHIIDETVDSVIKHKKDSYNDEKVSAGSPKCLMDMLMFARDKDTGRGLSEKELHDEVLTFMLAGHETSSVTMSWALLQLAKYPEMQQKAREEITRVLPSRGKRITWENVENLKYVSCILKETLRLYPAGPITMREAVHDDYLGPHFIPAGTFILCNMGACMRLPEYWPDPEKFDPERFMDELAINPSLFLPFITGPRKCMGYKFAMTEMTIVLAMLLREFEFSVVPDIKYKRQMRATVKPSPNLKLRISPVKQQSNNLGFTEEMSE